MKPGDLVRVCTWDIDFKEQVIKLGIILHRASFYYEVLFSESGKIHKLHESLLEPVQ